MRRFFRKAWGIALEKKISLLVSGVLLFLCIFCIYLYYSPSSFLYHNHFAPHFAAVFFEISLAVLIIEEIIKSKREQERRAEKRRFFIQRIQGRKIDMSLLDFLRETENLIQLLSNYRKLKPVFEKYSDTQIRLQIFKKHYKNFSSSHDTNYLLQEKMFADEGIQEILKKKSGFRKNFEKSLRTWETKLGDVIESVSLTSYPYDTSHNSWDHLVELQMQIQRFLRPEKFPAAHTAQEILLQKNNMFLGIYILILRAYCSFLMDYKYDFQAENLSNSHDLVFVGNLYSHIKKHE